MPLPYTSADFTLPRANGDSFIEYPFLTDGDTTTKIYHLICEVTEDDYAPIDLDVTMESAANADVHDLPFDADENAYHIGDYNHQKRDGVIRSFDRRFAKIPSDRNGIFTGTTAYAFPGLSGSLIDGIEQNITAASNASNITSLTCTNTVNVGDVVNVNVVTTDSGSVISINQNAYALTGTTTSVVKIPAIPLLQTFVSGTLTELSIQPRGQKTIPTGSNSEFTYYLPGVSDGIVIPGDVIETEVFAPFSGNSGQSVTTLNQTTIPDAKTYAANIDARDYITIESNVTKWFGNIIQKQDVKVRAL